MSNLSNKTEYKALLILGAMVKMYEQLHCLDMTKDDDMDTTAAKNLLKGVIETNGYQISYYRNNKKSIVKLAMPSS
ncbi:MAG: hypothetical protein DI598_10195 [Pseudopedobacter saltans]|uniref:Uncharacterized protein n=1 Tax=Pseudopedobacter saltans TaxID=151895 RepID=A0A2W5GY32_9SPHI|nr:MAG: hypothetical protein DI598_10195 [Pseudopedobacter saltans]